MTGKRVLVTGGAGFIGLHVSDRLVEVGCDVVVTDDLKGGKMDSLLESMDKVDFGKIDIRDYEALKDAMADVKVIFHIAADANVPYSVANPDCEFETNTGGTGDGFICELSEVDVAEKIFIGLDERGEGMGRRCIENAKRYE